MTTKEAIKLEQLAKADMEKRKMALADLLKKGKDVSYEKWLSKEQNEARIVEENL